MNDLQNAFALSRLEYKSNCQAAEIKKLTDAGKWVFAYTGLIHCRFTDAVVASEECILSVHDTEDEAMDALNEHGFSEAYYVGPQPEPEIIDIEAYAKDMEDCPF